MKILIVDDAVTFRKLLVMALESLGLSDHMEAGNVQEAQEILRRGTPIDLIISDWHMPAQTGLDLLRWVREQPSIAQTPFIMLTTEQERSHILSAARLGLQGYIFKPVQKTVLFQKLNELGLLKPQGAKVAEAEPVP